MAILRKVTRHDEKRVVRLGNLLNGTYNDGLPVVFIRREVLYAVYDHAASESYHEVGGYLIGYPVRDEETGARVTYIEKAIRAIYDSSPSHITLHAISFKRVEAVRQCDGTIIVGWYHSHPRMGIFFSGTDTKNHEDYHPEEYQIAIVVDPSRTLKSFIESRSEWIGFFGWYNAEWHDDRQIVLLPRENVYYVDACPENISASLDAPSVSFPTSQTTRAPVITGIARALKYQGYLGCSLRQACEVCRSTYEILKIMSSRTAAEIRRLTKAG